LDTPATYLSWNFILISVPNVLMILGMIAVFVVALIAPFPNHSEAVEPEESHDA
jgi:predicted phosphatase